MQAMAWLTSFIPFRGKAMEWREIQNFVVAAEMGSISRAAESLFITQPALSRQIRALEIKLGIQLFKREARGIELTEEGEKFLVEARRLLEDLKHTNEVLDEMRLRGPQLLRIGAPSVVIRYIITPAIIAFGEIEHSVEVEAVEAQDYDDLLAMLDAGTVQMIVAGKLLWNERLGWEDLYTYRMYALVSADHRFANRDYVTIEELTTERLLILNQGSSPHLLYQDVMGTRKPRRLLESYNPETLVMLAENGLGVALVTDTVKLGDFKGRAIPLVHEGHQVGQTAIAAWSVSRRLSRSARAFVQFLKSEGSRRTTEGYSPLPEPHSR
jgi:DNA-binding transcriptional LysR family regulator